MLKQNQIKQVFSNQYKDQITYFTINSNNYESICRFFKFEDRLSKLDLTLQKLKQEAVFEIFDSLKNLKNLIFLKIKINHQIEFGIDECIKFNNLYQSLLLLNDFTLIIKTDSNLNYLGIQELFKDLNLLTKLQNLQIEFGRNQIGEVGSEYLARSIEQLTSLESISLCIPQNYIGVQGAIYLFQGISKLTNLIYLTIKIEESNQIKSESLQHLDICLSKLTNLQGLTLEIGSNQIKAEGAQHIGKGLSYLKNLKHLRLLIDYNEIGPEGASSLATYFKNIAQLESFSFDIGGYNRIGANGMTGIANGLCFLENLKDLSFVIYEENNINEEGAQALGLSLKKLKNLKKLSYMIFEANNISNGGATGLSEGIKSLKNLKELSFSIWNENNISEQGAAELGESIKLLDQLQVLSFEIGPNLKMQGGIQGFGNSLQSMQNLKELSITVDVFNNIGAQGASSLGEGIKHLANLEKFNLSIDLHNNIGFEGASFLSEGISHLQKLTHLNLNIKPSQLGYVGAQHFANSIVKLPNIKYIKVIFSQHDVDVSGASQFLVIIQNIKTLVLLNLQVKGYFDNLKKHQKVVSKIKKNNLRLCRLVVQI
ncbi:hypothetical protein ABPG74_011348 [Tetrahymena malaccensis]